MGVTDQAALLQPSNVRLERQRLVSSSNIQPRYIETDSRTHSSRAGRSCRSRWLTSLEFKSDSVSERVALRLFHLHQDILLRIRSLRILHRRVDLAENSQIVEPRLRIQQSLLAQRLSLMNLQLAL